MWTTWRYAIFGLCYWSCVAFAVFSGVTTLAKRHQVGPREPELRMLGSRHRMVDLFANGTASRTQWVPHDPRATHRGPAATEIALRLGYLLALP